MRRLTCTEGGSNKFWEGDVTGSKVVTRWGRIGGARNAKTKSFASPAAAQHALATLVDEKLRNGYIDADAAPPSARAKLDPKAHPFLFYGVSPAEWSPGPFCGLWYVLAFRAAPAAAARKALQRAFASACGPLVDADCSDWQWKAKHALVTLGEEHPNEPFSRADFYAGIRAALLAVHRAAPLAEVVYLNARGPSVGDAWEAWTLAMQPHPSKWANFGYASAYFKA
jgi:predicted DNA-binding WGR domain protein